MSYNFCLSHQLICNATDWKWKWGNMDIELIQWKHHLAGCAWPESLWMKTLCKAWICNNIKFHSSLVFLSTPDNNEILFCYKDTVAKRLQHSRKCSKNKRDDSRAGAIHNSLFCVSWYEYTFMLVTCSPFSPITLKVEWHELPFPTHKKIKIELFRIYTNTHTHNRLFYYKLYKKW